MSVNENHIDHEVRIRLLEEIAKDTKEVLKEMRKTLEDKIDSHFKWMLGTMLLLIITVLTFIAMTKFH